MSPTTIPGNLILQSQSSNDPLLDYNTQPSLDLQFATSKTLDDRVSGLPLVDHQRDASGSNSPGTYVGSDGLIKTTPVNLLTRSEEFDQWTVAASSVITPNSIAAPDGSLTADQVYFDTVGDTNVNQNVTLTQNQAYTFSVYAKAVTPGSDNQFIPYINSATARYPDTPFVATSEWQRFTFTFTHTDTTASPGFFILNLDDAYRTNIYFWGAQLEEGSTASPYIKTTNLPSAAPRFDHDPTTGESLGLLIEEESTNLIKYSEPDSNSGGSGNGAWSFGDVDKNTDISKVVGPDGVSNSASRMQLATGSSLDLYVRISNLTPGEKCTFSGWVKLGTATNFALHVNNVLGWNTVADGVYSFDASDGLNTTTFVKISHTFTVPSTSEVNVHLGRHLGNNPAQQTVGTVDVWGLQVERKSFATSTIPTSGSTVNRAADNANITGSNFSRWYNQSEGTVFCDAKPDKVFSSGTRPWDFTYPWPAQTWLAPDGVVFASAGSGSTSNPALGLGIPSKTIVGYNAITKQVSGSAFGIMSSIATGVFDARNVSVMYIGRERTGANYLNSTIARLTYYPYRLPDATLQEITS